MSATNKPIDPVEYTFLRFCATEYEKKLIELMGKEAFHAFMIDVSKTAFLDAVSASPSEEFRDMVFNNLGYIFGEDIEEG